MEKSFKTVVAAERLLQSTSRETWGMSDAVLADVPAEVDDEELERRLTRISHELDARQITTPNGDRYTPPSLKRMRRTAIAWAPAFRYDEAAYRTHQEAGAAGTDGAIVLGALVGVARGEDVECPADVDLDQWEAAKARVFKRVNGKRRPRFTVTANDVRIAMNRSMNIPMPRASMIPDPEDGDDTTSEPSSTPTAASESSRGNVVYLLSHISSANQALRSFARRFVEANPSDHDREAITSALNRLVANAHAALEVVSVNEISDADLAQLLEEVE